MNFFKELDSLSPEKGILARIFMSWQSVSEQVFYFNKLQKQTTFIAKAASCQMRKRPVTCYCNRPLLFVFLVGATGFEPATPCSQSRCATRLRHAPCRSSYREKSTAWQARRGNAARRLFCCGSRSVVFRFQRLHEFLYGHNAVYPAHIGAAEGKAALQIAFHSID